MSMTESNDLRAENDRLKAELEHLRGLQIDMKLADAILALKHSLRLREQALTEKTVKRKRELLTMADEYEARAMQKARLITGL